MSELKESRVPPMPSQDQEAMTVSPEMLLAQIVATVGEEFVIIPTAGWISIVDVIQKSSDKGLSDQLEGLKVPVIPVSLAPKKEEKLIITPNDTPEGDSHIILP